MKVTAFVVGLIGSFAAFFAALLAGMVGGLSTALHTGDAHTTLILGVSAWAASVLGLVGTCLVWRFPKASWICLTIATVWIVISVSAFGVPGGVLFFLGAIFAFVESRHARSLGSAKMGG